MEQTLFVILIVAAGLAWIGVVIAYYQLKQAKQRRNEQIDKLYRNTKAGRSAAAK